MEREERPATRHPNHGEEKKVEDHPRPQNRGLPPPTALGLPPPPPPLQAALITSAPTNQQAIKVRKQFSSSNDSDSESEGSDNEPDPLLLTLENELNKLRDNTKWSDSTATREQLQSVPKGEGGTLKEQKKSFKDAQEYQYLLKLQNQKLPRIELPRTIDESNSDLILTYLKEWKVFTDSMKQTYLDIKEVLLRYDDIPEGIIQQLKIIEDNYDRVSIIIDEFMAGRTKIFVGVTDKSEQLQAGAGAKIKQFNDEGVEDPQGKTYLYVDDLTSAPWNKIQPAEGPDKRAVSGAGTALVQALIRKSKDVGCNGRVILNAISTSTDWYPKVGFVKLGPYWAIK